MIIWSIARTTVGDAMRKKVLQIFLVVAIGLIAISLTFSQQFEFSTRAGASQNLLFIKTFGLGLMALAGWLISLITGVTLIPQEIERRTIYTILSKPVQRYEFIVGKFLGALMTLGICVAFMGAVFVGVVAIKAHGAQVSQVSQTIAASGSVEGKDAVQSIQVFDPNTLWGVVLIYMQFMVLTSVVMMFSVFLTSTVNFFMGLGVYMLGVLAPFTETLANVKDGSQLLKVFYSVLHLIIPNFDAFNKPNALLHPEAHIANMGVYTAQQALYAVLYSAVVMLVAVIAFEKKEM